MQEGKPLHGQDDILTPLIIKLAKAALEGAIGSHLAQAITAKRKNGKRKKIIKSMDGSFDLDTLRDREGSFTPKLIKKQQTTLSDDLEQKIIALYGLGMSSCDISSHIEEMYGLEVSTGTLSAVTEYCT